MKLKTRISIIAVVGKNRELGKDNKLLWHLPEDLKYFKKTTLGHSVIMGYKTYEAIGSKPLPNRLNIILTFKKIKIEGCKTANSVDQALNLAAKSKTGELFIIGGASIFDQTIEKADRLYLTEVDATADADTFFPDYANFKLVENRSGGEYKGIKYQFNVYER